jgi:receptor protein-tyrosine kinase
MLREQTRTVVQSPGEASEYLTVPELGAIPKVRILASAHGTAAPFESGQQNGELDGEPFKLTEPFRATVTSILSGQRDGGSPHSFVITSAGPMEGKTTVVSQLGIALAEISPRVLLIDGDLRRPRLHKLFGQANSWGLTDILQERNAIETLPMNSLVRKTANPHLYLLPSGPSTDNIFGLLYSERLCRLLPRFRDEFEYVLFDAPPCLEFADARIIARYAEQTLLVVRANSTARSTAQQAVRRLQQDGIAVMGVILNNWEPQSPESHYYSSDGRSHIA